MSLRSAKESANLVSKKMLIGAFHRYQMKCKSVSKKSPRYMENSPEPVRNRVMILDRSDEKTPFELGVCAQKKRLHEPLIEAFWRILPNHK